MHMGTMAGTVVAMMVGTAMHAEPFPDSFDRAVAHSRVMNAGYVADATQRYTALPAESRQQIDDRLQALAALPPTAPGIGQALALLGHQVDGFPHGGQRPEGSGRSAGQVAMQAAGMCVVHGRLAEAADAAKGSTESAAALVRTIKDAPAVSERDRGLLLRELEQSFGRELYAKASAQASARKGSRK